MSDSESSDCSSSYDESESSSERGWTCDDIYPTKAEAAGAKDDDDDSSSGSYDTDSSSSFAGSPPAKGTAKTVESSDSTDEEEDDFVAKARGPQSKQRPKLQRHSSADIEAVINAQEEVLAKAEAEEKKRQALLDMNRESLRQRSEDALNLSNHLDKELEQLSEEMGNHDDEMVAMEKQLEEKQRITEQAREQKRKAQKDQYERKNIEREMRLAKARERIEKKKEEEAKKQEQKIIEERNNAGKLDMSKAARVERAYSWYTRMAMPTREKMKQRVEFMPASSGVTPDDVDLLPWNARGTFVSVAAMMRMNRTASNSGNKAKNSDDSDSDSD